MDEKQLSVTWTKKFKSQNENIENKMYEMI